METQLFNLPKNNNSSRETGDSNYMGEGSPADTRNETETELKEVPREMETQETEAKEAAVDQEQKLKKLYALLELKPGATFSEIKSSYLHLKKLYGSESAVLNPVIDEISEGRQQQFLEQVEEAYKSLKEHFSRVETEKQAVTHERVSHQNIPEFEVYSGNALKLTREVLNVQLNEISLATGIPLKHLENIEKERFELLPPLGYVKIYVSKYAEYLSLDVKRVAGEYMKATEKRKKR